MVGEGLLGKGHGLAFGVGMWDIWHLAFGWDMGRSMANYAREERKERCVRYG